MIEFSAVMAGKFTHFLTLGDSSMRSILALIIALMLFASADAGEKKSKWSWGAAPQWKWNCATCPCESCPAQPAAKPEPVTVEAPAQTGTIVSGSCANGSCGGSTSYSSGLFRRRR